MGTTKILLVDDHPMLCQGLRQLLEREKDIEVVAEARDGEESIQLASEYQPNVVVMDIGLPNMNGIEATREIKKAHPHIAVLILTIYEDDEYIIGALEAGASGYLLKTAYGKELVQAIKAVQAGEYVLYQHAAQELLRLATIHRTKPVNLDKVEHLTAREADVLKSVSRGMTNQEIATELGINTRTVKGHLVSIFAKMRVSSRTEAVMQAIKYGLIEIDDIQ